MIARSLAAALLHFVWQGALVGLLLWTTLLAMRRRSANQRYAVSCAALALLAMLPAITAAVLCLQAGPSSASTPPVSATPRVVGLAESAVAAAAVAVGLRPVSWFDLLQLWTLPVWSAGVLLFSMRLAGASVHVLMLERGGESADDFTRELVDRLARRMSIERRVRVLISTLADGPSVIGWLRPIVLLPPATAMGLTPQQLEAVLAHELAHIRRCDYLVNIVQMMVETVLFYHPVVWWASKQIRIEREFCCDDLAVASCGDAVTYARALTTLESRRVAKPALAMGSTGGSLLYRIQRLTYGRAPEYGPSPWPGVLAMCLGLACVVFDVSWVRARSQAEVHPLTFEVASVKPNKSGPGDRGLAFQPSGRFMARNVPLKSLIATAYGDPQALPLFRIVGGPDWVASEAFDIEARAGGAFAETPGGPAFSASGRLMLRTLLADRFKVTVHHDTRELPLYALRMARKDGRIGPQLRPSSGADCVKPPPPQQPPEPGSDPTRPPCGIARLSGRGRLAGYSATLDQIATILEYGVGRVVSNRTGLSGIFSFAIEFTPELAPARPPDPAPGTDRLADSGASIFTVVQEQLGLTLEPTKGPVDVLVIDHVDRLQEE